MGRGERTGGCVYGDRVTNATAIIWRGEECHIINSSGHRLLFNQLAGLTALRERVANGARRGQFRQRRP